MRSTSITETEELSTSQTLENNFCVYGMVLENINALQVHQE
ncbi:hypothetical protein SAMD00079811_76940 (plasmid) [Scytonema sp. HK-05]|nr:hypothetical protein SAMD00079811_76940 [Scytonema sp. HK-05]